MEDHSEGHLQTLKELAREYEEKYREFRKICQDAQPEWIAQQLKLRSDLTTDRFRSAQQALLAALAPNANTEGPDYYKAATTLCRCFDEMRILFQILLEYGCEPMK